MMLAADPARVPVKPADKPKVVVVQQVAKVKVVKPKPKPVSKPKAPGITPADVLHQAQAMINTAPVYNTETGWCWHFVEEALQLAHSPVDILAGQVPTNKPVAGDIVYFFLPSTRDPSGIVGHVAIMESMDADWIYVINGNGSSSKLITRDRYSRAYVDTFVHSV